MYRIISSNDQPVPLRTALRRVARPHRATAVLRRAATALLQRCPTQSSVCGLFRCGPPALGNEIRRCMDAVVLVSDSRQIWWHQLSHFFEGLGMIVLDVLHVNQFCSRSPAADFGVC